MFNIFNKRIIRFSLVSLLLLFVNVISAEESINQNTDQLELEKILISPHRVQTSASSVGSSVSIVDQKDVESSMQYSVLELLRRVPGLEIVQAGGAGRTATLLLRGAESDQTLVLVDGVRLNTTADGSVDFADLRADNIERIEVLRGPQSVLYGSEALGGVISIVTKNGSNLSEQSPKLTFKGEGGSYSTQDYSLNSAFKNGGFSSSNSLSFFNTSGISTAVAGRGNSEKDGYENFTASTANQFVFGKDWSTNLNLRFFRGDTQLDGFDFLTGPVDDLNYTQLHETLIGGIGVKKNSGFIRPSFQLGVNHDQLVGRDSDTAYNSYNITNQFISPVLGLDFHHTEQTITSIGYSFEDRRAKNIGEFNRSRNINSAFLNQQIGINDNVDFSGGLRFDEFSDFGSKVTYRATLSAKLPSIKSRLHTSYGTGFKAPTFNELYFPGFGNPNLGAEKTRGFDVGVENNLFGGVLVNDTTFFRSQFEDLISFNTTNFNAENIASSSAYGIEEQLKLVLNDSLQLGAGYTFMESKDNSTKDLLARRPRHRLSGSVRVTPVKDLNLELNYLLVRDRIDSDQAALDNYDRVDLTAKYNLGKTAIGVVNPYIRCTNLFDTRYEEVAGYGTLGLAVYGGLEIEL